MQPKSVKYRTAVSAAAIPLWAALALFMAIMTSGLAAMAAACTQGPNEIVVRVSNLRSDMGNVVAVLYGNDPPNFLKRGTKLEKSWLPASTEGTVDICLTAPQPGLYAVAVYHDENANIKFDKNWLGLPSEGYGISNNPTIFLGPPTFDEAKFEALVGPTIVPVEVRY